MYHTGELVRFLADSGVDLVGRTENRIRLHGIRIQLDEVRTALERHPGVGRAFVQVQEDADGDDFLAAYLIPGTPPTPTAEELRSFVGSSLPEYMAPSAVVLVEAFPLNSAGKVDGRSLPAARRSEPPAPAALCTQPQTALERTIAGVWAEVLEIDRVGRDDSFFDLGGHSVLLIRAHSRVCAALQRSIDLFEVFEHPTVRALAEHLDVAAATAHAERLERSRHVAAERRAALARLGGERSA
jgi:hypothetical protein